MGIVRLQASEPISAFSSCCTTMHLVAHRHCCLCFTLRQSHPAFTCVRQIDLSKFSIAIEKRDAKLGRDAKYLDAFSSKERFKIPIFRKSTVQLKGDWLRYNSAINELEKILHDPLKSGGTWWSPVEPPLKR